MSVNIKQLDGTLKKVAGNTILLDGTCSEIQNGTITIPANTTGDWSTTVTMPTAMTDTDYIVIFNILPVDGVLYNSNANYRAKTTTSFIVHCEVENIPVAQTLEWYAFRLVELEGYNTIYNKMTNIDAAPTESSTNLVTSGGVYDAIKNASSVFVGTAAEWAAETDKTDFNVALITDAGTVNAVDDTTGDTEVVANKNVVFKGTMAEWNSLTTAEKKTYDEALITNDMDTGEVVNAVTDGDMRAVTSNAVYDAIANTGEVKVVSIEKTTVAGLTTGWYDGADAAHRAYRNGKQVVMNINISIIGTFTGTTGWQKMFEMPTSLLEPGESFAVPYMISGNDAADSTILNGNLVFFENGQTVNFGIKAQIILFVV